MSLGIGPEILLAVLLIAHGGLGRIVVVSPTYGFHKILSL